MEENQNTNDQHQPKQVIPLTKQSSESVSPGTSIPASPKVKEETPASSTQPQTSNIEPQTDSMEVHKHPHHVMHKKKWGEYFLEFLMIFFAVFMGFVAENIREGIKTKRIFIPTCSLS